MDEVVYVVQAGRTKSEPIGVYTDIRRAREEAGVHAVNEHEKITRETVPSVEQLRDRVERLVFIVEGQPVACYAIYTFPVDEDAHLPNELAD